MSKYYNQYSYFFSDFTHFNFILFRNRSKTTITGLIVQQNSSSPLSTINMYKMCNKSIEKEVHFIIVLPRSLSRLDQSSSSTGGGEMRIIFSLLTPQS